MRLPPLNVIVSWPAPNYDHPVTHGPALLIVNLIFITLVAVAVAGRLYSRIAIKKWYGADDSMIILALLFTLGMTAAVILANERYGWNRHVWDLPLDMIVSANQIAFVAKLMFVLASTFTRLSLICFYYRLVKDSGIRWFNYILHASVAWTVAVCILFICQVIWLCVPVSAYWIYPPNLSARCLDEGQVMLGGGIINCFSDLLTTVLPIPIVVRLQMPVKQRVGVCILLCLGFIVTIAGVIRTYFIWKSLIDTWDETWFAYPLWIAAAVEIDLAVICACAPAWKSLLQQPIIILSSRLSSKLSSLRTPSNSNGSPSSTSNGKAVFNPLRSLPWFQITRMDFEKHRSAEKLEQGLAEPVEMPVDGHHVEIQPDIGARDFRHSDIVLPGDEISIQPAPPKLKIIKRQSLEQESAYIGQSKPRRSIGSLLPGQWMGEKRGKASLPKR